MRLIKLIPKVLLVIFISTLVTGCSQKFNDVSDTLSLALYGNPDTNLISDDVSRLPYASIYARIGDGPQAFLVLAFAELPQNIIKKESSAESLQLKWLSADHGMLVTEHGRLIKTINIPNTNLLHSYSETEDPLKLGLHRASTPKEWRRRIDWQPGYHFGYELESNFDLVGNEVVIINDKAVETLHFRENVTVMNLDEGYTNHFWIIPTTGKVVKSIQKLAPGQADVTITLLKPFS